jgi:hypothetical protein
MVPRFLFIAVVAVVAVAAPTTLDRMHRSEEEDYPLITFQ